jgi:Tfp pilus assembly protein PilX
MPTARPFISRPPAIRRPRRGFALLITITLLAFLVLLLVSLASLTRVETQVASNNQQLAQARQNALLALNIAIGQLQKYAGPDQRITAPADLIADTDKAGTTAPAVTDASIPAHITVSNGARYWTGIWGNGQPLPSSFTDRYKITPDQINGRGVTPVFLNWLVSGNEKTSYTSAADGSVTAGTGSGSPLFLPNATVTIPANPTATSTVKIKDSTNVDHDAALLVGPNTVGTTAATGATAADYVAAPLVTITASAGTVPGLAATATPTIGRYAYWVGDEGVKARLNLRNGYLPAGSTTPVVADQINSFITSQRSGIEFIDRDVATPSSPDPNQITTSNFNPTSIGIPKLLDTKQLTLIGITPSKQVILQKAAQLQYHSLSASSLGVISDTYAGGLKKDLTADIADTSSTVSYRPTDSDPIFTPLTSSEPNLPTWGHLRSWTRYKADASGKVSPVPASDTEAGFSPVVSAAYLGMKTYVDNNANPTPPYTIHLALYPIVVLSNPYPVTIKAADYDIGFKFPADSTIKYAVASTVVATLDLGSMQITPLDTISTFSEYIRFGITGSDIPPGETHIYVLPSDGTYDPSAPGSSPKLQRAPNSSPIGITRHLVLSSSFTIDSSTVTPSATSNSTLIAKPHVTLGGPNPSWPKGTIHVVFAPGGQLPSPTSAYQTYDMLLSERGGLGTHAFQTASSAVDLTIAQWPPAVNLPSSINDTGNNDATLSLRMFTIPEDFDGPSTNIRFGAPSFPLQWMRMGNMRAPFQQPTTAEITGIVGSNAAEKVPGTVATGATLANTISFEIGNTNSITTFRNTYLNYAGNLNGDPQGLFTGGITAPGNPPIYTTLFDILDSPDRLLSLGQLQNVPFSRYSFQPPNPFANSMADVRVARTATYTTGIVFDPENYGGPQKTAYDLSWQLNRALWDKYFVSGVPSTLANTSTPLPNARMIYHSVDGAAPALTDVQAKPGVSTAYDQAAAHLMVAGAFNINSTSEQAWRAILGSPSSLPTHASYADSTDSIGTIAPYPRISHSLVRTANSPYAGISTTMKTDSSNNPSIHRTMYHGNRGLWLNDSKAPKNGTAATDLIKEFARTMVQEIRKRGPFLSLADFVNRPIYANKVDAGIKGAIQDAIDHTAPPAQINPLDWNSISSTPYILTNASTPYSAWDAEHYIGGSSSAPEFNSGRDSYRLLASGSPKYLTQADILSTLGPLLSARSDTFTVRTYGETTNPVTGDITGRAWCEAVLQRMPEYVDTNAATGNPDAATAATGTTNLTFGRKFKIVSFRWLSPSDI